MDHAREDRVVLQKDGVIATLKQMPTLCAETIEADGEGTFQPMHPFGEIGVRSFEGKMEVIAHDHIGVQSPVEATTRRVHGALKRLSRAHRRKHITAIISAVDNVVKGARVLDASFSSHAEMQRPKSMFRRGQIPPN